MPTTVSIEQLDADIQRLDDRLAELFAESHRVEGERAWLASTKESLLRYLEYSGPERAAIPPSSPPGRSLTATEWAEKVLGDLPPRSLQETWPLITLMQEAGYQTTADKVYLTVYGSLLRASKKPDGAIVKVGAAWGLRSWYPEGVPASTTLDMADI